jgi:hypothetical protein
VPLGNELNTPIRYRQERSKSVPKNRLFEDRVVRN